MRNLIVKLAVSFLALLVVINVVPGINAPGWKVLLAAAVVISVLNVIIKPVLMFLTLPINVLTLGIFTLFINAFLFYLVSVIVNGFVVEGFWPAFFGALVFSIISIVLNLIVGDRRRDDFPRD